MYYIYICIYDAALRGAATLRARMQKGYAAASIALAEEHAEHNKEPNVLAAIDFVSRGGELLKRTRKGNSSSDLDDHINVNVNSMMK